MAAPLAHHREPWATTAEGSDFLRRIMRGLVGTKIALGCKFRKVELGLEVDTFLTFFMLCKI